MNDYEYLLKFIMIGDSNVGKSCLLMRLLEGRFKSQHEPTLGVQFGSKIFHINKTSIKLQVWDTAGQQSFKSITRAYYKGSIAAILVFDITNEKSFLNVANWLYQLKNHSHQKIHIVLVGNKTDLSSDREVSHQTALEFAQKHGIQSYYETSALNGDNIQKPFLELSQEILKKIDNGTINIDLDTAYGVKRGRQNKQKNSTNIQLMNSKPEPQTQKQKCNC